MDPDPHIECGSGSMRIRIHSPGQDTTIEGTSEVTNLIPLFCTDQCEDEGTQLFGVLPVMTKIRVSPFFNFWYRTGTVQCKDDWTRPFRVPVMTNIRDNGTRSFRVLTNISDDETRPISVLTNIYKGRWDTTVQGTDQYKGRWDTTIQGTDQ